MKCDWQSFLKLIPQWMRVKVDQIGKERLQEVHLRLGRAPQLFIGNSCAYLDGIVTDADLNFTMNCASQYSPWTASTVASGYITAQGGHRIGICGRMVIVDGKIQTVRNITSLCIRVARDFPGIARQASPLNGSILIIGSPGRGKTTLLRDLIRQKSSITSAPISVVDERCELFPVSCGDFCFSPGENTDVLSGCKKADGIEILVRTMNPVYVAVDEITAIDDCRAIIRARGCGVSILATAHAANMEDFYARSIYRPLWKESIFQNFITMQPDKSWKQERMTHGL